MDEVHRKPSTASSNGTTHAPDAFAGTRPLASPLQRAGRASKSKTSRTRKAPEPLAKPAPTHAAPIGKGEVLCSRCAALCCRYVALPLDNPEKASDYDDIRWYLMHENIHVFVDDGQWYVGFAARCKNLADDNRCMIYETRPRVCRGYDTDNCEFHGTEYRYEHLFTSADQLQRYAEKELGRSILFRPRPKKPKLKRGRNGRRRVELPIA